MKQIRIQGPGDQDFYFKTLTEPSYTLKFNLNGNTVFETELDHLPTQEEIEYYRDQIQ